jgi:DNA-directed RNA polymerase specialized sigma24 family protein
MAPPGELSMNYENFPKTAWTVVRAAQGLEGAERCEAMNRCIAAYWKPVFCFLRARGKPLHQAEDLTQEFFLQFFEHDWIRLADQKRGRFRTFLLTILTRFLSDQSPPRAPRQKTFDNHHVAVSALLGDSERNYEPPLNRTPENIFMQQWAHAVIDNVRRSVQAWCIARGRPDWYRIFHAVHFPDAGSPKFTQQALADDLHVSRDQIRYGLEEVQGKFIEFLKNELADQVDSEDDLDKEILELEQLLVA